MWKEALNKLKGLSNNSYLIKYEKWLGSILLLGNIVLLFLESVYYIALTESVIDVLKAKAGAYIKMGIGIWMICISLYLMIGICVFAVCSLRYKVKWGILSGMSAYMGVRCWHWMGMPDYVYMKIIKFSVLILILLLIGHISVQNGIGSGNSLDKMRDDIDYIPVLLDEIKNETLRKRIANEVYSYVYGAKKYKLYYKGLRFCAVLLPALIGMFNAVDFFKDTANTEIVAILSMVSVIVTGILGMTKAKDMWVRYREYAERAKNEIFLYVMEVDIYAKKENAERENLFIREMEELFAEENGRWKSLRIAEEKKI